MLSAAFNADIRAVFEAAAQLPDARFEQCGPLLTKLMREVNVRRRLESQDKLAPHVQSLVQVFNEDMAKTASEVIR